MRSIIIGKGGRLGKVILETLQSRGDEIVDDCANYLIFAHRYRGPEDMEAEMKANCLDVVRRIERANFVHGDRAIVVVSSIGATEDAPMSLSYAMSKAALNRAVKFLKGSARINSVSPAGFTGSGATVTKQQVADVIAFLCSPQASGINGENIIVRGQV